MWDLVGNPEDRFSQNEAHINCLNSRDLHQNFGVSENLRILLYLIVGFLSLKSGGTFGPWGFQSFLPIRIINISLCQTY